MLPTKLKTLFARFRSLGQAWKYYGFVFFLAFLSLGIDALNKLILKETEILEPQDVVGLAIIVPDSMEPSYKPILTRLLASSGSQEPTSDWFKPYLQHLEHLKERNYADLFDIATALRSLGKFDIEKDLFLAHQGNLDGEEYINYLYSSIYEPSLRTLQHRQYYKAYLLGRQLRERLFIVDTDPLTSMNLKVRNKLNSMMLLCLMLESNDTDCFLANEDLRRFLPEQSSKRGYDSVQIVRENGEPIFMNYALYLNGLELFQDSTYQIAIAAFDSLRVGKGMSDLMRDACTLMIARCLFWDYDKYLKNQKNDDKFIVKQLLFVRDQIRQENLRSDVTYYAQYISNTYPEPDPGFQSYSFQSPQYEYQKPRSRRDSRRDQLLNQLIELLTEMKYE